MRIDAATRTIKEGIDSGYGLGVPRFEEACKLGIEALKELLNLRETYPLSVIFKLPGETQ